MIQDGPYGFVRHPMYTSLICLMIGMALILGSWLALVPAALFALLFSVVSVRVFSRAALR